MKLLLQTLAWLLALPVLVASATLLLQTLCARLPRRAEAPLPAQRPRLAVLVPAHDEAAGIAATLASVRPQLGAGDRLLVVADNCGDATAAVARAEGAEVVERCDPARRGKGYALDFGLRHLDPDPPEVVIVLDADCIAEPGALDRLARTCAASGRPVQGLYLMRAKLPSVS